MSELSDTESETVISRKLNELQKMQKQIFNTLTQKLSIELKAAEKYQTEIPELKKKIH